MTAFNRGKRGNASIYVPTRQGGLVQRSTGTRVPSIVRGMASMVQSLRDRALASGQWAILDAIQAKRVTLRTVYQHHVANTLPELDASLSAANLSAHLDGWIAWVRASRRTGVRTADVYWQQVTTLVVPETPFPASELTKARCMAWLASRTAATTGTKRKYLYALKSFVRYLLDVGVLTTDPLAGLRAPKKNAPRERWESAEVDERIVANANAEYRALFAFIKATGCDVGAALRAQLGDVNLFAGTANIRGTKTDRRRVHAATIEAWALPYLRAHVAQRRKADDGSALFPTLTRNAPSKHHQYLTTVTLGIADYTLKDARHSVAVRMRLRGASFEAIAQQLGTSVFQAVTVYSRYQAEDAPRATVAK